MIAATAPTLRDGTWQADPGFGIYVHVPFCLHRCHYCDFNTYEGLDHLRAPYVEALVADIERYDRGRMATSVFFGGGTPTLLHPEQLGRVLHAIDRSFGIADDAEVTVEANPETVDVAYLSELRATGVNRLSIGVQSLSPHVLERLGRTHSASQALRVIEDARRAGFDDLNIDLIYGSPWESSGDWLDTLNGALATAPDHISAYSLMVEEGTPLHTLVATGRVPDVDVDAQAERFAMAAEILGAAGYVRYEVSNWSRPGHASRHNVLYWSAGDYFGFGAGAHSHVGGHRWWTTRLPRDYIGAVTNSETRAGEEILEGDQRAGEALMLGLRLASGIDLDGFRRRFGDESIRVRTSQLTQLRCEGLIEWTGDRLRLSAAGTLLANDALCRLL